jgi:predicted DNA helicase
LAVDNLVERLDWAGERVVRLGHPARVLPQLRARTLDVLVDEHPDVALARRLLKEADQLRHQAAKFTRAKPPPGHKQELRQEAAALRADARRMEQQVVDYLLDSATVIAATLSGLPAELLGERRFDLLVIDEASQATEPACWPALVRAERVVFAGDHCQLPPTVLSNQAAKEGLTKSAMERLTERKDAELAQLLTVQYRMHAQIMRFSSDEFYQGRLTADATVAAHSLADLFPAESEPLFQLPLEFLDTAGSGCDEVPAADGQSLTNPGEGAIAVRKVQRLAQAGLPAADIALITPYAAQARWLEERLANDEVEVDTVDGFQGREKEAVIVSLVRSNPRGEIGFLGELRRLNVAFTRAKRKLLIIGDSATLAGEPFFQRLIAHVEACGGYRTIWEEPELND